MEDLKKKKKIGQREKGYAARSLNVMSFNHLMEEFLKLSKGKKGYEGSGYSCSKYAGRGKFHTFYFLTATTSMKFTFHKNWPTKHC